MTNRILDFSDGGYYLRVENQQLVVEPKEGERRTLPLEDIAVILLSSRQLVLTQAVLAELAECGGVIVVANNRGLPTSMCLPLYGRSLQAQKLAIQSNARAPKRKQIWQRIVIAKIKNQSAALKALHGEDGGLAQLVTRVRSGDPENVEAQAARRYWPLLFKSDSFRRRPGEGDPPNHLLDYGYAVLRAIIARAICASGLHPTFGVHHHERDNSFALADDLMEPYRPLIDHCVASLVNQGMGAEPLSRKAKATLIEPLLARYPFAGEHRTLFDLAGALSAAVLRQLQGEDATLPYPTLFSE